MIFRFARRSRRRSAHPWAGWHRSPRGQRCASGTGARRQPEAPRRQWRAYPGDDVPAVAGALIRATARTDGPTGIARMAPPVHLRPKLRDEDAPERYAQRRSWRNASPMRRRFCLDDTRRDLFPTTATCSSGSLSTRERFSPISSIPISGGPADGATPSRSAATAAATASAQPSWRPGHRLRESPSFPLSPRFREDDGE